MTSHDEPMEVDINDQEMIEALSKYEQPSINTKGQPRPKTQQTVRETIVNRPSSSRKPFDANSCRNCKRPITW